MIKNFKLFIFAIAPLVSISGLTASKQPLNHWINHQHPEGLKNETIYYKRHLLPPEKLNKQPVARVLFSENQNQQNRPNQNN